MRGKIDNAIQSFVSSFIGTDATSLLEFVSHVLRNLNEDLIPRNPKWLGSLTKFIRSLSTNRPTPASRSAYTNCAGALLLLYPESTPQMLFLDEEKSSKPFSYLFINLILVDLRATLPSLLEKLNDPDYPRTSQRLASALDILTAFIGQLLAWIEELEDSNSSTELKMSPDLVLKLSKSIAETLSVTMEYLRDRWDASVAGAQGLHPEARAGNAHTASGSHKTLAWDAKDESAATDAFILSAIRAIALWVRDDDGDALRKEGAGLMDMFMELYQSSSSSPTSSGGADKLDFRLPILTALEGVLRTSNGIEAFNSHDGWRILSEDLLGILTKSSGIASLQEAETIRGTRIALVLQIVVESETSTPEDWMGVVTAVAAYAPVAAVEEGAASNETLLDFQADVLHLATSLLVKANPGTRRRYVHSAAAVQRIAAQLAGRAKKDSVSAKEIEDVISMLAI
ncbi:Neurochondrin-domain-containing protein [Xylariaceae sp. FL0662B]|nr:Neurochondrin-domain-containing protein [Xylariaceae sp. FL0662B]